MDRMTEAEGKVSRILTQLINDSPKTNFSNVENRNFQLTLLNAFSALSVTMMVFNKTGLTFYNLWANTLAFILMSVFINEIG